MAFPFAPSSFRIGATKVEPAKLSRREEPQRWFSGETRHRFLSRFRAIQERRLPVSVSAIKVEALEPRYLLSADLIPMSDLDGDGASYTLEFDAVAQAFKVYDDETGELVDEKALSDVTELTIQGTGGNDRLTLDVEGDFPAGVSILFDGGAGTDRLAGPAGDTAWRIDGQDAGTVKGLRFVSVERLEGAADNEDTFTVTGEGGLSDGLDGGEGGFDSMIFDGGSFSTVTYDAEDAHSGTVTRDGQVLSYEGLEPITDAMAVADRVINTNLGTPPHNPGDTDVSYLGTDTDDRAELESLGGGTHILRSVSVVPTFESVTFLTPTNSLTINLGGDLGVPFASKDVLTILSTDLGETDLTVNGEDGKDEVIVSGDLVAGNVTINAETIEVSGSIVAGTELAPKDVTLAASDEDDGALLDPGTLGGVFDGLYIAVPEARVSVTGSVTATGDLEMTATASVENTMIDRSEFGGVIAANLVGVLPTAEILLDGATLSGANISGAASVDVDVAFVDAATGGEDSQTDAAISGVVVGGMFGFGSGAVATMSGGSMTSAGTVSLTAATDLSVNATADGSGGDAGAALAFTEVNAATTAGIDGNATVDAAGDVTLSATLTSAIATAATSTAGGAEDSEQGETTDRRSEQELAANDAETAEGSVSFAATVTVSDYRPETGAALDGSSVTSGGAFLIKAMSTDSVTATSDATNTGSGSTGVGVAVAVGIVSARTSAAIMGSSTIDAAGGTTLAAEMDADSTFSITATSGVGDSNKTGIAGSLAIHVVETDVSATVESGAVLDLSGGSLTITATSATKAETTAEPNEDGVTAESLGIGASVALAFIDHQTVAEIGDTAAISNGDDLTLTASSTSEIMTKAVGGAKAAEGSESATVITPVVAITFLFSDTTARIGTGSALTLGGGLSMEALHDASSDTDAEGDAEGGSTAFGASFAMSIDEQTATARLLRDLTASGGAAAIAAKGIMRTRSSASAAASGAEEEDTDPAATEDDDAVDQQSNAQLAHANEQAASRTGSASGETETPSANTSDGSMSVAAAITVNVQNAEVLAELGDGVTVAADGQASLRALSNVDSRAVADGSASQGQSATIGAAAAVNSSNVTTLAQTNGADVTGDGVLVEAGMAEKELDLSVDTHAIVDLDENTIFLGDDASKFSTGDEVTYSAGGGTAIEDGSNASIEGQVWVIVKEDGYIQLATSEVNANDGTAIDLTGAPLGNAHTLTKSGEDPVTFDSEGSHYTLASDDAGRLRTGDALRYEDGGGTEIGGLTSGTVYYAVVGDDGDLKLAESLGKAADGKAITITGDGDGALVDAVGRSAADATSGASDGDIGVAGALAINSHNADTDALISAGSTVGAVEGTSDGEAGKGAVEVKAATAAFAATKAGAKQEAAGNVGVGASFALTLANHDTAAAFDPGAEVSTVAASKVGDLSIEADSEYGMRSEAEGGAEGGTAVAPVVAISVANNDTSASAEDDGSAVLDIDGDLGIHATHVAETATISKGDAKGTDAAVGLGIGFGWADDDVSATLTRDVTSGGGVSVIAEGAGASTTLAAAGLLLGGGSGGDGAATAALDRCLRGHRSSSSSVPMRAARQSRLSGKRSARRHVPSRLGRRAKKKAPTQCRGRNARVVGARCLARAGRWFSAAAGPSRRRHRPCGRRSPIRCRTRPARGRCGRRRPWSAPARRSRTAWCG